MKKFLFVFLCLLLLCVSCSDKVASDVTASEETTPNTGYLNIVLPKKSSSTSRSLKNSEAASVANFYSVVIWNPDTKFEEYIEFDSTSKLISLPVGEYKVLAVAGVYTTLCGSGYATGVIVEENKTTSVPITLVAPTLEIEYLADEGTFYTSEEVALFKMHFSFNNPYLEDDIGGSVCNFDGNGKSNSFYFDTNNDYTYTATLPVEPGTYKYGFNGTSIYSIYLKDYAADGTSYISTLTHSISNVQHKWGVFGIGIESYDQFFEEHEIVVAQRPTSMSIELTWKEDD